MDRTWSTAEVSSVPWVSDLQTLVRWIDVASLIEGLSRRYIFGLCGEVLGVGRNVVPVWATGSQRGIDLVIQNSVSHTNLT